MRSMRFAIVGEHSPETLPFPYREEAVSTPYGDVILFRGALSGGEEIVYLSRHGVLYSYDSSYVNYRANVYALYRAGVTDILSLTSVGACDYSYKLGSVCLLSDFIDFTKQRPASFEKEHRQTRHCGMEDVFDPELTDALERRVLARGMAYAGRAVYACTEGPRFQTAAEIRMLRMLGAQVVGMTIVPEAPLARELGMRYACLCVISNHCTGMTGEVTDQRIDGVVSGMGESIMAICTDLVESGS